MKQTNKENADWFQMILWFPYAIYAKSNSLNCKFQDIGDQLSP